MAAPYGFPEQEFAVWQPPIYQQPRVGLAVVCRCLADGSVECLLQRRGQHSHTPGKWSFPGGRLDQEGDLDPAEDFGAAGTLRELGEECGGGSPLGLPSLIHIMRMYNDPNPDGKSKQTMYHVYAVDLDKEPDWAHWQPRPMRGHEEEVDTSPTELIINGNPVRCINGQCWVNLEQLCIQCCQKMQNLDQSPLHPGLVKWVQNHAMNILKYLIARSPKIARSIQKPHMGSTGSGGAVMAPRFNRSGSGGRTKRRQSSSSMLAPPLLPGQAVMQPYLPVVNPLLSGVDLSQIQSVSNIQVSIPSQSAAQEVLTNKQAMPVDSSISGAQPKPFPSMAPLTIQTQQQQQQLIQEQQSLQVAENIPPATSVGTFPQMPMQGSHYYPANQKQPLMSMTPDEQQQLALLQLLEQQQQQQMLAAAANMGLPQRSLSSTREVPCSYFLNGNCLYGDKCWYSHTVLPNYPMMSSQQPPLMSPQSATSHDMYTYPQQPTVDQNYYYMPSPPQSPLAFFPNSPTWPIGGGNRSSFIPYQARMPSGVHPNNSRFMFSRFPVNPAAVRMQQGAAAVAAAAFMAANGPQVIKRGDQSSLRFALVSEIPINSDVSQSSITHLTTRGDHFYITLDNVLRDYRILLQPYRISAAGQTYALKDTSTLPQVVSYLYCSRDTGQLFIGTKSGSIYRWDTKHSERIDISINDSSAAVTSLIHFYTSLGSQIVVSGNCVGVVTWYIMQPPQKTFTVLLTDHRHEPHSVTSIQLLGSILLSGSLDGTVHCWNMQSSRPVITATIRAHSVSLSKIHVINSQHFVTIGNNSDLPISLSVESADASVVNEPKSSSSSTDKVAVTPDDLATSVIKLALESSGGDKNNGRTTTPVVTLWKFENPPKSVKTYTEFGAIISSSVLVTKFAGSFLAMALQRGSIVVYHVPDFTALPEFPADVTGVGSCKLLSLSLARELPSQSPSREIMLTVVQTDNTVKVYQVK